jgi:hypothetical protein
VVNLGDKTKQPQTAVCKCVCDFILHCNFFIPTNNQAFYSQASWGRLEMKPHELKKQVQNKSEKEGKNRGQ